MQWIFWANKVTQNCLIDIDCCFLRDVCDFLGYIACGV